MLRFTGIDENGRKVSPRQAVSAWWGAAALLLASLATPVAGSAQDAVVVNRASVVFTSPGGNQGTAAAEAAVSVRGIAGVQLVPSQSFTARPGDRLVFAHRLTNLGSGPDAFGIEVTAPAGWNYQIFVDSNGDGIHGPEDRLVNGPLSLGRSETIGLLLVLSIPADASDVADAQVDVRAVSTSDATVSDAVQDRVTIRRATAALSVLKNVSRAEATAGDTLTYTISFANAGEGASAEARLDDLVPAGVRYVRGSMRLDATSLTDDVDGDAGLISESSGRDQLAIRVGSIAPKSTGTITFRAVVNSGFSGVVSNVATLIAGDSTLVSPPAITTITLPELRIVKELLGGDTVRTGAQVSYRITWSNASSTTPVFNAVLTDTLPAPLEFASGSGSPVVAGRIVRWDLGTLAPSQSGTVTIAATAAGEWVGAIVNTAVIAGSNARAVSASATALHFVRQGSGRLEIEKRAGVLEAGLGDAIPYIVTLRNSGDGPLSAIVVDDRLPEGVEFAIGKLTGADSAHAEGRDVRIWLAGPLDAGAAHTVRYVVNLVAPGSAASLQNSVSATANDGAVRSDTAVSVVQVRKAFSMQTRLLVGKVWVDSDENGRQNDGEPGIPGVEVWSADGEVVVTDAEGRYSFRNLRLGTHAFRIDTLALPPRMRLASSSDAMARVRVDGWTTPSVNFRVLADVRDMRVASVGNAGMALDNDPLKIRVDTEADTSGINPARVSPLRLAAERAEDERNALVRGPAIRFLAPIDGSVARTNRIFVGVTGEPGAPVKLFLGDSLLGAAELRPDGRWDFINVEIPVGPSRLRVAMKNSWNNEVWDSVAMHRAGAPHRFSREGSETVFRAESQEIRVVTVRVTDSWGVPVPGTAVSVDADGGIVTAADTDRSSIGIQLRTASDGLLRIPMRANSTVGAGRVLLIAGKQEGQVGIRVLPSARSLIAVGTGQIGIGASPENFGALTMKGALGRETAVSVSYDSRRGSSSDEFFGRGYDPLEEGRYPALGDASERRVLSGSTQKLSARIERGFNWLEMGDLETGEFGGEGRLAAYRRSLSGVAARVGAGPLTMRAFGSLTDQVLSQIQVRGNGSSGPYTFGRGIRPGTDRIIVEVRSARNASLTIAREELQRFRDYQIDYATGEVLLQRPLESSDASGNPLFLVGMLELKSGGDSRMVAGGRIDFDAAPMMGMRQSDSLRLFVVGVRDEGDTTAATRANNLVGGGMRLQAGLFHAGGELMRTATFDSTATATRLEAGLSLPKDLGGAAVEWTRIAGGFVPGMDPRLTGGSEDLRFTGNLRVGQLSRLELTHSRQKFDGFGVERNSTVIGTQSSVLGRDLRTEAGLATDMNSASDQRTRSSMVNGKVKLGLSQGVSLWIEGSHTLAGDTALAPSYVRPDQISTGMSFAIAHGVSLESSQRWVGVGADSGSYSVTSLKLKTESLLGGSFWVGMDRAAADLGATSVTAGWSPRRRLTGGWVVDGMLERRVGLNAAPLADPLRALPFPQLERDRWAAGLGAQWLPKDSVGRISMNGEVRRDDVSRGYKVEIAGEAPMSETAAFLTRHDIWQDSRETGTGITTSRRARSLGAIALRPTGSNTLNLLGKVEWRRTVNPGMGAKYSGSGEENRLIGSADAIWAPSSRTEVSGRYAMRMSTMPDPLVADSTRVRSLAHFAGGRVEQNVFGPLSARIDGRLMRTGSGAQRWNVAPSAVLTLGGRLDLEAGYRHGNLMDADFAQQGGKGFFATMGVRLSENTFSSVTGFWRNRVTADRPRD